MDEAKKQKRIARLRKKYVNMKKHKHPNASFSELWGEARVRYPD